jgi:hypothetical protein
MMDTLIGTAMAGCVGMAADGSYDGRPFAALALFILRNARRPVKAN